MLLRALLAILFLTATWFGAGPALADHEPHGGVFRHPDVSATHVVFVYGNDLWLVPREGGIATPLASPPGLEAWPRFAPDGRTIAFVGDYDGAADVYTLPVSGGVPHRVTWHPTEERLCDWTPDGQSLVMAMRGLSGISRRLALYRVPAAGGLPEPLPVPYGGLGSIDGAGRRLAYVPQGGDHPTWKRYRGGRASDVWVFDLEAHTSRRLTDWEGADSWPMWQDERVYFVSNAGPSHRMNIWVYDLAAGTRRQVTSFTDQDVRWPAMGPGPTGEGEIVFKLGTGLHLLDIATEAVRPVPVTIPGARPALRPHVVDAAKYIERWNLSPTGKRAVVEARGDIWTLPAKEGSPRNLTRTSGHAERDPAWSPDGIWIAYFSDATGEYELYVRRADGKGEPRQVTKDSGAYYFRPVWSPDAKRIAFTDKAASLYVVEVASGKTTVVDRDPMVEDEGMWGYTWSHDGRWLAYARTCDDSLFRAIHLHDTTSGKSTQVTSGRFSDENPTFDRTGGHLFFKTSRHFTPTYADTGQTWIYANTEILVAVPLRADQASPFAPKSDEEEGDEEEGDEEDGDQDEEADEDDEEADEDETVEIDLDGFENRAVRVPVDPGHLGRLAVNHEGHLLYERWPVRGIRGDKGAIHVFDLGADDPEEKEVASGIDGFQISADGKHLIVEKGDGASIQKAAAGADGKRVPTSGMKVRIEPRAEWRQVFTDVWRIIRDYFYDPRMHGVDWDGIHDAYRPMLEDCVTREDVTHVMQEMIGELNVGHANYHDKPWWRRSSGAEVGLLGADFALENGAYRLARIHRGAPWDVDARGPLGIPGLDVKEGDYLLAVDGVPVDPTQAPWAAFDGRVGRPVTLTVSVSPTLDEDAREVLVVPTSSERQLRYRAWVEAKRLYVDEKSGGRVGYVHVPNTGRSGQNELYRQSLGQFYRPALIVDERWNGGGQLPDRFVELLNRPTRNYWARRDGRDWHTPFVAHQGPKCMLINESAGSGGDAFPWYFRQSKLGKLIGTRTWGGLVGISGNPRPIDGTWLSVPTFAFYEPDGTWGIEGHGVDPDIEVIDDPALMWDGGDPQLDRAIEEMLAELERSAHKPPKRPAYPDRSGMGLPEEDR